MAPEQVEGGRVDGRADLYALACAAFEWLSGAPPFRREAGMAVVWAKLSESPPLLSTRRTDLPGAVDGVMSRAMATEPDARYPTCGEFAAALRDACGLGPAAPRPPARPPRQATQVAMPFRQPAAEQPPAGAHPATEVGRSTAADAASGAAGAPGDAGAAGGLAAGGFGSGGTGGAGSAAGSAGPPGYGAVAQPVPADRPWWRSRAFMSAAAAVVVVALVVAAFTALHHGHTGSGGAGGGGTLAAAVKPPGCTTAAAKPKQLSGVRTQNASVGGKPFGVAITSDGKYSFISTGNDVVVLDNRGGSLAPAQVATIPAQGAKKGEAITPNGKYLLAAAGSGAYVISVPEAEAGDGGA